MDVLSHIFFPLLNFFILTVFLLALMKKPVRIFLATRREQFKLDMQKAKHLTSSAEAKLQESDARLKNLAQEIDALEKEMEIQMERESKMIIGEADEQVDNMHLDARRQVAYEIARLKYDIYLENVAHAFEKVEGDIQNRVRREGPEQISNRSIDLISRGLTKTPEGKQVT